MQSRLYDKQRRVDWSEQRTGFVCLIRTCYVRLRQTKPVLYPIHSIQALIIQPGRTFPTPPSTPRFLSHSTTRKTAASYSTNRSTISAIAE